MSDQNNLKDILGREQEVAGIDRAKPQSKRKFLIGLIVFLIIVIIVAFFGIEYFS